MNPHLLIRLPDHRDHPVHWLLWSLANPEKNAAGHLIASGVWPSVSSLIENYIETEIETTGHSTAKSESRLLSSFPVTILVPSTQVTLHTLEVRGRLTNTVRKSLPWRLEEELSEDVDNLHFSILHHADNQVQLAVVSQQDMEQWQSWLSQAGIDTRRWVPDALMLPYTENQCHVLPFEHYTIARYGQWQTAACERQWQPILIEGIKQALPDLTVSELNTNEASPLATMALEATHTDISLLQGEWQATSQWKQNIQPWIPATILGVILLVLTTGNSLLTTYQLEKQTTAYQQQSTMIFQQLFPGERVIKLKSQMQQKLTALQQPNQRQPSMLQMLAQVSPVLKSFPELQAISLGFSTNNDAQQTIRIKAQASNFEKFSRLRNLFKQAVNNESLTIDIEAIERTGDKVTGTIVISGAMS